MSTCRNMSGGKRRRSTKRSTRRRSTRRRRGGANAAAAPAGMAGMANMIKSVTNAMGAAPAPKMAGGKRRHTKKVNKWSQFVKQVYHKGKKADKNYSFSEALKEASKLKKAGKMHA